MPARSVADYAAVIFRMGIFCFYYPIQRGWRGFIRFKTEKEGILSVKNEANMCIFFDFYCFCAQNALEFLDELTEMRFTPPAKNEVYFDSMIFVLFTERKYLH